MHPRRSGPHPSTRPWPRLSQLGLHALASALLTVRMAIHPLPPHAQLSEPPAVYQQTSTLRAGASDIFFPTQHRAPHHSHTSPCDAAGSHVEAADLKLTLPNPWTISHAVCRTLLDLTRCVQTAITSSGQDNLIWTRSSSLMQDHITYVEQPFLDVASINKDFVCAFDSSGAARQLSSSQCIESGSVNEPLSYARGDALPSRCNHIDHA